MDLKNNPLVNPKNKYRHNAFAFDEYALEHYESAIDYALEEAKKEIKEIKENLEIPNFENTVLAMELSGELLGDVTSVFFNLLGAESNNEFKALAQVISPKLSEFSSSISLDPVLFEKVKIVYDNREKANLNDEQLRVLEKSYKGFVRNGALLNEVDKEKLMKIDMEMSRLSPQFSQNLLNSTNAYELHIKDEKELDGLPKSAIESAKFAAKQKNKEGFIFTLQIPSMLPILTYAKNRKLREDVNRAYGKRAFKDEFDNQEILKKIAELRFERANILGYKTHADYVLENRMAENMKTVFDFADKIYEVALPAAKKEVIKLEEFAKNLDNIDGLKPWDSGYYSEKLKKELFDYDAEDLRPYFKLENVIEGIFKVANKMYGLVFTPINDIPVYHKDVKTFEVTDENNQYVGLFYMDMHPRETKRGGAWMTTFRSQGLTKEKIIRPHVAIVCNLTPGTDTTPSLLRLSEVTTIFHEFGHALHALLSNCTYTSVASPNVYWDFVELPSQIMENWVLEEETLELFAKHYETGEIIPKELIEKVRKSRTFNAGMANIRQLSLIAIDMAWHAFDPSKIEDVEKYENDTVEKYNLLPPVGNRNTSTSFGHIFAGGYSSGYYSYKWAEVLEADAFELFLEKGIFDKKTAFSFRDNILSKGNSEPPMDLFVKFRGRKPDPDAVLRRDGLIK